MTKNKKGLSSKKTKLSKIEKKYGKDFGAKSVKKMKDYLNQKGYSSLATVLET